MQTEVGEAREPFVPGQGTSSTRPQKRNPIACCYITANAAVVRQHLAAVLHAKALLAFLTSPQAAAIIQATGLKPVTAPPQEAGRPVALPPSAMK